MPNSSRSISVVALNPMTSWPHGLFAWPSNSTSSSTSRVTSRIVRSPISLNSLPDRLSTRVLLKVSAGQVAVAVRDPGVDAGRVNVDLDVRLQRVFGDDDAATGAGEATTDLAH